MRSLTAVVYAMRWEGAHIQTDNLGSASARHSRIADIEVLRAFAIGMVLVEHARINLIPWIWDGGPLYGRFGFWSGVDLFLAVSGFVIARSLLPTLMAAPTNSAFFKAALSFWVRRAWRLLPSAWLWLAICVLAAALLNRSGAFGPVRANVEGAISALLNVTNIYSVRIYGRSSLGAVFPYWSLSLEEQFYIALPFVAYVFRRRLWVLLVCLVGAQFFVQRADCCHASLLLNLTRCDALALGVLLALWTGRASHRGLEPRALTAWPARWLLPPVLLAVLAAASGPHLVPSQIKVGVVAFISAAIVWIATYDRDYIFPPGAFKRAMCWLGSRSYGIYLTHIPAFFLVREFWTRTNPQILTPGSGHMAMLIVMGVGLALLLADLNFRLVEDPFRRHGARLAHRTLAGERNAPAGALP